MPRMIKTPEPGQEQPEPPQFEQPAFQPPVQQAFQQGDCIRIPPQLRQALELLKLLGSDDEAIAFVKGRLRLTDVPEELKILAKLLS
ncbi:MAG: hypothetical protein QXS00_07920 [Pyrobaculum sp.]